MFSALQWRFLYTCLMQKQAAGLQLEGVLFLSFTIILHFILLSGSILHIQILTFSCQLPVTVYLKMFAGFSPDTCCQLPHVGDLYSKWLSLERFAICYHKEAILQLLCFTQHYA